MICNLVEMVSDEVEVVMMLNKSGLNFIFIPKKKWEIKLIYFFFFFFSKTFHFIYYVYDFIVTTFIPIRDSIQSNPTTSSLTTNHRT